MIKEARGFGATIDEAKENAIANLGASELEDIQFEVIAMPKKKTLGLFGGSDAEIRAFVEIEDKKAKPAKKAPKAKANKLEKAAKAEVKAEEPKKSVQKTEKEDLPYGEPVDESKISADSPAGKAIAYIRVVLAAFGCNDIDIKVRERENASLILINGEDLSIIIGRRGETLDSLQYLASLVANNGGGHYKISLNIGNYREKREETLTVLAKRISEQVLKTGKSRSLEPMNPYERRIIHTAIQEIDGVVSTSFGEGIGRRVVISPVGVEVKPPKFNDRRRNNRGNRRSSSSNASTASNAVAREPKKDSDIPLYGKIN